MRFPLSRTIVLGLPLLVASISSLHAEGWDGLYGGLQGGYGFGGADTTLNLLRIGTLYPAPPESPSSTHADRGGFLGGFQFGYNTRIDRLILGPEADLSFGRLAWQSTLTGIGVLENRPFVSTQSTAIDRLATIRERVGYLATDSLLVYGAGGLALGKVKTDTGLTFSPGANYAGSRAETQVGWTIGAGVETPIIGNWRMKLEYLHYDLGSGSATGGRADLSTFHTQADTAMAGDLIRVGLNYPLGDFIEYGDTVWPSWLTGLTSEFGTRYWYSGGSMRYDLSGSGGALNSRLSYDNLDAHSGELFAAIEHPSGLYAKATLGAGGIVGGSLTDEDFPPVTSTYSRTDSRQQSGNLSYATVDVGYWWLKGENYRVGPLVGFNYFHEQMNATGCTQTAANPTICAGASPSALVISENADWFSSRIGIAAEYSLPWYGMKLSGEGVWSPYGVLNGDDTHWLRQRTGNANSLNGPILQFATTHGYQFEAVLTLPVTRSVDIGVGGRIWYFTGNGSSVFDNTNTGGSSQSTNFSTRRTGAFAQLDARF